jgi:hypothetical protein
MHHHDCGKLEHEMDFSPCRSGYALGVVDNNLRVWIYRLGVAAAR